MHWIPKFTLFLSLLLALCACSSTTGGSAGDQPVVDTIESVSRAVATAWREHIDATKRKNLPEVLEIYAHDIVYVVPGSEEIRGWTAIQKMEAQRLAASDVLYALHTTHDLRFAGDVAYELGTVMGPVREKGRPARTVTYRFMALWKRQADGTWRIQYLVGAPER